MYDGFNQGKIMTLREYLFKKRLTQEQFAESVGLTRSHLSRIVSGALIPSRKTALKIEEVTKGKVTANELLFPEKYPEEEI